jgi:hypothetical protein
MVDLIIPVNEARINVGHKGQNGDLPDPVSIDASDEDVKRWVAEAIRTGGIPGIPADPDVDLTGYMVDRYPANEARPWAMIGVRPKTVFGQWLGRLRRR